MRKLKVLLFILLVLLLFVPMKVSADMFEKPSAEIKVVGVNQPYYFELLIKRNYPVEMVDEETLSYRLKEYYRDDFPLDILNGYQDEDGYASRTLYNGAPAILYSLQNNLFKTGYFSAPQVFKIAIITKDGNIITSNVVTRKLFRSTMTFDLTDVDLSKSQSNVGVVKENIPMGHISWRYIVRVAATIGVELIILALFMYRLRKSFIIVGITNFITQSILTLFMFIGYYSWGADIGLLSVIVIGEILVFIFEMVFYRYMLKEKSKSWATFYGFIANLATLIISILTISFI
ncbi:MAG: hypothetical protein WC006_05950 [Bacilli bacterium]|nr:DUF418 domain-containing protein [Bacilli bacterium]